MSAWAIRCARASATRSNKRGSTTGSRCIAAARISASKARNSRCWRKATFIAWLGFAYHILIAWPLMLTAKTLGAAAPRPLRLLCLIVPVLIVLLITGIL